MVQEVLNVIRALAEEGRTMLLVTHEMSFARQVSSEVVFLHQGLVEEQGTPQQVSKTPSRRAANSSCPATANGATPHEEL